MKKIKKPAEKEDAVYYSDFSGKYFGEIGPDINLKIEFNYGSKYDGSFFELHLTDDEIAPIFNTIKKFVSEDFKNNIKKQIKKLENGYDQSVQFRDWDNCNYLANSTDLLKFILNDKE